MISSRVSLSVLPFWVALILGGGSLVLYMTFAALSRMAASDEDGGTHDFNLGIPHGQSYRQLFAISMAAAGTPLSTVVAFFFIYGPRYGIQLFWCPIFFAAGILIMYWVYCRASENGYFSQGSSYRGYVYGGLLPFMGKQLSGSEGVGSLILVICSLPLLGLLTLEVFFGIQLIDFLYSGAAAAFDVSGSVTPGAIAPWKTFCMFALFVGLLFGYVFVGGFRAVLRSDVWQYKIVQSAVVISLVTFLGLFLQRRVNAHWSTLWPRSFGGTEGLVGFYVPVVFVNLVLPLGLVSSWQRFRAFEYVHLDMRAAVISGLKKTVLLWTGLITVALSFALFAIRGAGAAGEPKTLGAVLEGLRFFGGDWCEFFVFPMLIVAGLSSMYSCSDTCVSALLYLIEYSRRGGEKTQSYGGCPATTISQWHPFSSRFFVPFGS